MSTHSEATRNQLEGRFSSRKQWQDILGLLVLPGFVVVAWVQDLIRWQLAVTGLVVFGGIVTFGVIVAVLTPRRLVAIRLDPSGILLREHSFVPWADLSAVVLGPMRPRWLFLFGRSLDVVAFIPRPGVRLPGPPGFAGRDYFRKARNRVYGTNLVLLPRTLDVSTQQLVAASQLWGQLPIRRQRGPA